MPSSFKDYFFIERYNGDPITENYNFRRGRKNNGRMVTYNFKIGDQDYEARFSYIGRKVFVFDLLYFTYGKRHKDSGISKSNDMKDLVELKNTIINIFKDFVEFYGDSPNLEEIHIIEANSRLFNLHLRYIDQLCNYTGLEYSLGRSGKFGSRQAIILRNPQSQ